MSVTLLAVWRNGIRLCGDAIGQGMAGPTVGPGILSVIDALQLLRIYVSRGA
jgi:hypothetical protein